MSDFIASMKEQRAHYKNFLDPPKTREHEFEYDRSSSSSSVPKECDLVETVKVSAQNLALTETRRIEAKVEQVVLIFQNNQTTSSVVNEFNIAMTRLMNQVRKDHEGRIDALYDEVEALGIGNPEISGDLLDVMNKIGGYFVELFEKISFVESLVADAIAWITHMSSLIKSSFIAIRDWIANWF